MIPPIDDSANILLLIGRDLLRAHHILDQIRGTSSQPYAQQLPLGWVIIGEACLDGMHTPSSIDVMKTMICSQSEETPVGFLYLVIRKYIFQSVWRTIQYSNAQVRTIDHRCQSKIELS